ncbi:hypothetical protein E4U19_006213 [Claviceps sp. Clav32 group G5]|nr:hypothetical protein E4U19_006213 [Claviceps sp. Clav32 group G5]KAG6048619.1 hypothetical protein E4U39_007206 [Claviceps sp. Clav50 group G5]
MVFLKAQVRGCGHRDVARNKSHGSNGHANAIHRRVVAESPIHFVSGNLICMPGSGKPKPSNHPRIKQTVLTESRTSSSESDKSVEATIQAS